VLDARLQVDRLDLATLPQGLLPESLRLAGRAAARAAARGPTSAPAIQASLEVEEGSIVGVHGLTAAAEGTLDAETGRATADARVRRADGGELELRGDVPLSLATRSAPLRITGTARALPLDELARIALDGAPLDGVADLDLAVTGTTGRPEISATASIPRASYGVYGPFAARVALDDAGRETQVRASADWRGTRAVEITGAVPLDTAELLRAPARSASALLAAPLDARVVVPGLDLALLAGVGTLPADLRGIVKAEAKLRGTVRAPRGELGIEASGLAVEGWKDASIRLAVALGDAVTAASGKLGFAGDELVEFQASLSAAPESLVRPGVAERAPFHLDVRLPGMDLARIAGATRLAGTVHGTVSAAGTLDAPQLVLALGGERLAISGRPLGDVSARGRAGADGFELEARLAVAQGGVVTASLASEEPASLQTLRDGRLARAPATARLVADRVNLAFLPAALPGIVRTFAGELGADVVARGPLARMRPQGFVRIGGGSAAVAELGEWTGIEVDATLAEEALQVRRLEAHRGGGRIEVTAEARGLLLRDAPAQFTAEARARGLRIPRAGQDLLTLEEVDATMKGTFDASVLRAELVVPRATIRLPRRPPRALQPLDERDDIIVGAPKKKGRKHGENLGEGEEEPKPYRVVLHLLVPNRCLVRSDSPRIDVELKADTTFDFIGSRTYSEGSVEVLRGEIEPLAGRRFDVQHGRVTFVGGEPKDAQLDVAARYDNPNAKVTVTVTGPVTSPTVKMTSEPALDESQIAMLIATGQTDPRAGAGGVSTLNTEDAGKAALGVVATRVFKDLVADKLPLDTVAIASTQTQSGTTAFNVRAGKYVTDRIYVGYTRNFEAQLEKGENQNEFNVQYQISSRWTFESRYGDARTGGASLIWSKDY
jgi:translocation and assembly module TamB